MKMSILLSTLTATALITSHAYAAEPLKEKGGYIGLAYGASQFEDDGAFDGDVDDDGRAWQIYGGYRFFKYLAVEGRYTNFGEFKSDLGFDEVKEKYSTFTAHALGIYPFGQSGVDIYGQLGVGFVLYEFSGQIFGIDVDVNDTAGTFSYGAGLRYTPPGFQRLTVQLAYDAYLFQAEGPYRNYDQSLSMAKLGVQFNF